MPIFCSALKISEGFMFGSFNRCQAKHRKTPVAKYQWSIGEMSVTSQSTCQPTIRQPLSVSYWSSAGRQSTDIVANMSTDISRSNHIGRVSVYMSVEGCTKYTWSDFTLSNVRWFYLSKGAPLRLKGLNTASQIIMSVNCVVIFSVASGVPHIKSLRLMNQKEDFQDSSFLWDPKTSLWKLTRTKYLVNCG